jgi:hypothetical protein
MQLTRRGTRCFGNYGGRPARHGLRVASHAEKARICLNCDLPECVDDGPGRFLSASSPRCPLEVWWLDRRASK